ncbi:phosphodiesterase [Plakobranchus ocellatus]|uniref:Phosphodiesterase n=1 Tax=Plakobranchus ocellatus TaxID=259542 RepID=A0AAV4DUC4_9GAST|nr:phosphodiesterase [Plakobranchus ocellatus]
MKAMKRRKLGEDFTADLNPDVVKQYLRENPDVLDQLATSDLVHTDRLRVWLEVKTNAQSQAQNDIHGRAGTAGDGGLNGISMLPSGEASANRHVHNLPQSRSAVENGDHASDSSLVLSQWKAKIQMSKKKVLHELSKEFHHISGKVRVLLELADCVASAISADSFTLFSCDNSKKEITHLQKNEEGEVCYGSRESIGPGTSVAATVAHSKEPVRLKDLLSDKRMADGLSVSSSIAHSVMALPVVDDHNNCFGVVELSRHSEHSCFTDEEEEVGLLMLQWFDMLLDYVETHSTMMRQRTLSDFLLEVTKSIFQDIVSMDVVIMKIMNFAKALVQADRTALFLLDTRSNELYARIFDDGYSLEEFSSPMEAKVRAMDASDNYSGGGRRRSSSKGRRRSRKSESDQIEGDMHNMQTSSAVEEKRESEQKRRAEWYSDDIRRREIRRSRLKATRNPKCDRRLEKKRQTKCGKPNLYEKIRRSEQKYKVALDVLSYHSQALAEEVSSLRARPLPDRIPDIST